MIIRKHRGWCARRESASHPACHLAASVPCHRARTWDSPHVLPFARISSRPSSRRKAQSKGLWVGQPSPWGPSDVAPPHTHLNQVGTPAESSRVGCSPQAAALPCGTSFDLHVKLVNHQLSWRRPLPHLTLRDETFSICFKQSKRLKVEETTTDKVKKEDLINHLHNIRKWHFLLQGNRIP